MPFLLAEWLAMKLCSPGTRVRLGALGVGRVRMLRAGKGNLGHSLLKGIGNGKASLDDLSWIGNWCRLA